MAMPGSCPSTAAPSAGHPPICLADASGDLLHSSPTLTPHTPANSSPSHTALPLLALAGGAGSQDMLRPRLVLFGDSITEQSFRPGGWGAALADTYSRKADVVVRGYGGYNSRWALFLIQRIFPLVGLPPVATTIFFGANDAALPGRTSQRQHVLVEEYKQNLKTIVNHLKDCSKSMVILLITPPPIDEDGRERYARMEKMRGGSLKGQMKWLASMQVNAWNLPKKWMYSVLIFGQRCKPLKVGRNFT
ncbi:GDSL esterase/lipase At5g62930-like isoform X3 [Triticum dicoccoides]|uniref:GDSL esterase/lipase At5g62930-like isoform X3 n=1 Tax=Triticum dicoccoides TaxID=85692 RepID=UPI00189154C5|nr:GDSL esterase/lipase At5g62930-like isoform X3 [Triticum dicoccoides]